MERKDFTLKRLGEQTLLLAGVAIRLTMCPGDDIALVTGSLAAGSGHEAETHEAIMPTPLELNFGKENTGRKGNKNPL